MQPLSQTINREVSTGLAFLEEKLTSQVPASGIFDLISYNFPLEIDNHPGNVKLTIGPWKSTDTSNTDTNERRYFEVKVTDEIIHADSSQWIYDGTNEDLVQILKQREEAIQRVTASVEGAIKHIESKFR